MKHGNILLIHFSGSLGNRAWKRWYDSFTQMKVLKRLVVSNTGKGSSDYSLFSSLRTEHWAKTIVLLGKWSWKGCSWVTIVRTLLCIFTTQVCLGTDIGLKRPFISDNVENSTLHIQCPVHLGDSAHQSWYNSFTWEIVFKRPFVNDTRVASACWFRSPRRPSSAMLIW